MRDDSLYPAGPPVVPEELAAPAPAYRWHAALALLGLVVFGAAYLAFTGWLAWTAGRLLWATFSPRETRWGLLVAAVPLTLLTLLVGKALFFIKRGAVGDKVEVTAADEPRLFAFLHQLADEARAPRPHRVFLSYEVNAGVFYDLSPLNFLFPSKKNLIIGLGVVNALTLSELKAVLAHELGHFTQRTMAIGRWVYIAHQVAAQLVLRRDSIDRLLAGISSLDPRVAWAGWVMQLVVWSVRSVADTLFRIVVAADRALTRELERHADLVAVSLTGSDALVHGLHRLTAADAAMDRTLLFLGKEKDNGRAASDVLALQRRVQELLRAILDDPLFGEVPPLPERPESHRLFTARTAHPPKMWSTHPPNEEREESCKARYVAAPLDDRSAWLLFSDRPTLCQRVTALLYAGEGDLQTPPLHETMARIEEELGAPHLSPRYRGVYLGRSAFLASAHPNALYDVSTGRSLPLREKLATLYSDEQRQQVKRRRELTDELSQLAALEAGFFEATGGVIRNRGRQYKRSQLSGLVRRTKDEIESVERELTAHDRRCRSVHLEAARELGGQWEQTLRGLAAVSHYATHAEADLDDAIGALHHAIDIALTDGRVSRRERNKVLSIATTLYMVAKGLVEDARKIELGAGLASRLGWASWQAELGQMAISEPAPDEIGEWMLEGRPWCIAASFKLAELRTAALAELLGAEDAVAQALQGAAQPAPPLVPAPEVRVIREPFLPENERPRQARLGWWDRFVVAQGYVASTARFAVSGSIIGVVLLAGNAIDRPHVEPLSFEENRVGAAATVFVYNGLDRSVRAIVGGRTLPMAPGELKTVDISTVATITSVTLTEKDELIERVRWPARPGEKVVYNIGGAAAFFEWPADERGAAGPARLANTERWFVLGDRALALDAAPRAPATALAPARLEETAELVALVAPERLLAMTRVHARWDDHGSTVARRWLAALAPSAPEAVKEAIAEREDRIAPAMDELVFEATADGERSCEALVVARDNTADPDVHALADRCAPLDDELVLDNAERWPNHPRWALRAGRVHAAAERWEQARKHLEKARARWPGGEVAIELARVRRAAEQDADLEDLLVASPALRALIGDPRPPAIATAVAALSRGELDQALAAAERERTSSTLLPLVAASANTSPALIGTALAERPTALGSLGAQLGLAIREKRDSAPYREQLLARAGDDAAALRPFLLALSSRKVPKAALLRRASPLARGVAYSAAQVALGGACPPAWRALAQALLFPGERPHLP